jgi:hypothetical protein
MVDVFDDGSRCIAGAVYVLSKPGTVIRKTVVCQQPGTDHSHHYQYLFHVTTSSHVKKKAKPYRHAHMTTSKTQLLIFLRLGNPNSLAKGKSVQLPIHGRYNDLSIAFNPHP